MKLWIFFLLCFFLVIHPSEELVGILYEGWHTFAANAFREIQAMGGTLLTVEQVIRSDGKFKMYDILGRYNKTQEAANFYYQVQPTNGYYCIYRKRPNESGVVPDCPNIPQTLQNHANLLLTAGIDYVVIDSTNLPVFNSFSDAIQVRPTQVLFEEWHNLQSRGIPTPKAAVWSCIPSESNIWQIYLDTIYNNKSYENIVLKDPQTGKKIFFIVASGITPNQTIIKAIESNGGRNDTIVVPIWALFGKEKYSTGYWAFFSPCTWNGTYTSSVVSDQECNQYETTNSSFGGTEMSASNSYQLNFGSIPFGAPGKLRGLTMKKLFKHIFAAQPHHVFISSWNEFISQPQPTPFSKVNTGFSKGLPFDPDRNGLYVDSYGSEFSRDIEPTVEYGDYYYRLLQSCVRVYKSGATTCTNSSEECCNFASSNVYKNVYSLSYLNVNFLLSTDRNEVNDFLRKGWKEICTPFVGPTEFCVNSSLTEGQSSSFIIYSGKVEASNRPLYRCLDDAQKYFFSLDPKCEGFKTVTLLGFISSYRTGDSIRGLYRCYHRTKLFYYHSLDIPCPQEDTNQGLLGYVR